MITYIRDRWRLFNKYKGLLKIDYYNVPLDLIYEFINTLDREDTLDRLRRFRTWEPSKKLLDGPSYQQMTVDREFEPGTFGDKFKRWSEATQNGAVDLFKVSLEVAPRGRKHSKLFEAFQRHSMMQHDLIHFFNGYDTTTLGEVSVLSFHLGHEWKQSWVFFIFAGLWSTFMFSILPSKKPKDVSWFQWLIHLPIVDYCRWVREAYKRGKNSKDFMFIEWDKYFDKPFDEVLDDLNLNYEPKYWKSTRTIRFAWAYEARKKRRDGN